MAAIVKETLGSLSPKIRITLLSVRDGLVTIKGVAQTQGDFEKFLEDSSQLQLLGEPIPGNLKREKEQTHFELTYKIKM